MITVTHTRSGTLVDQSEDLNEILISLNQLTDLPESLLLSFIEQGEIPYLGGLTVTLPKQFALVIAAGEERDRLFPLLDAHHLTMRYAEAQRYIRILYPQTAVEIILEDVS